MSTCMAIIRSAAAVAQAFPDAPWLGLYQSPVDVAAAMLEDVRCVPLSNACVI